MDLIQAHQLVDNKKIQHLFSSQITSQDLDMPIPSRKVSLLGYAGQPIAPTLPNFTKAFEFFLISSNILLIVNNSLSVPVTASGTDLINLTELKVHYQPHCHAQFTLSTSKASKIVKIFAENFTDTQVHRAICGNAKSSVNLVSSIRPLLVINLSAFAESCNNCVKFSLKSLHNISDKVTFTGILLKSEDYANKISLTKKLIIRDTNTRDQISVYVSYPCSDQQSQNYLSSISLYDTLSITANRLISSKLNIFCKLSIMPPFTNLTIISKHSNFCTNPSCCCKNPYKILFKSYEYSLIYSVKPTALYREIIKLSLRVLYLNSLIFKDLCENCGNGRFHIKTTCCDRPRMKLNVIAMCIAEDSSGIAECEVKFYDNLERLLCLDSECVEDMKKIAEVRQDCIVKYDDFPGSLKDKLKNLPTVLKFCVGKVEITCKENELVKLNAERDDLDLSFKILKVF